MAFTKTPSPPNDRFDAKVKVDDSGCWLWIGHINKGGYGRFGITGGVNVLAHRYSYERHKKAIPEGMQLDHLCRVRSCVNPDHLEPVTNRENVIRGNLARPEALHCKRGHEFTQINTRIYAGKRCCRACARDRSSDINLIKRRAI